MTSARGIRFRPGTLVTFPLGLICVSYFGQSDNALVYHGRYARPHSYGLLYERGTPHFITFLHVETVSEVVYLVYKRYEPSGIQRTTLLLVLLPGSLVWMLRTHFTNLLHAFILVYIEYWMFLVSFVVAYRISPVHPLASYPGPIICKVSRLWFAFLVGRYGKSYLYVHELHKQYGEVVRIGPNELSITHKDAMVSVLGPKGLPRGPYYCTREHKAGTSLDGLRDISAHALRRKPWAKGMNSAAMKYYESCIKDTVNDLMTALRKREGEPLDISAWMSYFGFDFMGRMSLSFDFGMLRDGCDSNGLFRLIRTASIEASWISHLPWVLSFANLLGGTKTLKKIQQIGETTVEHRIAAGSDKPDLFHYLLGENDDEMDRPSKVTAIVDGQLAIIAGSDTAATTISHLWYFLLAYPEYFRRLRKEIDETFARGVDISSDLSLQSTLPYLNACINESLRLYPPVLNGLQREVRSGTGGKMIGPYFVPEQTQVSLWAYSIQRDPQYYSPLTDTFWPDRWLVQDNYTLPSGEVVPKEQVRTDREVFMPFSQGPMVCAGKAVALAEIRAVVCAIVHEFDIELADRAAFENWENGLREAFVALRGPLPIYLNRRE